MAFDWSKMWSDFTAIREFIFSSNGVMSKLIFTILANGFLTVALAIWVVRKVSNLFDYIVH